VGEWIVGTDVLARSRFAVSPLIETVAAFKALSGHSVHPWRRPWVAAHTPAYRSLLAADPFARAFVAAAFRPRWVADFLVTPPESSDATFDGDLVGLRSMSPREMRAELEAEGDYQLPPVLRGGDLVDRVEELITWAWRRTVEPEWSRRRRLFEADIVTRAQRLGSVGWAGTVTGMRPDMRWIGEGRLQVNAYDHPPQNIADATLSFIPTTCRRGWIGLDEAHRRYTVVYPCAGTLADPAVAAPSDALARLLGAGRALILAQLDTPRTTTQLAALTGYALGSVGGHLRVLLDAQLVHRRRSGRAVLYYRSPRGDHLVSTEP